MIPQHTIQDIRERSADDIVDIIGSYIKLKRSGASYKAQCPFHEENTPSFSVSEAKGIYKCFGCGEGGDAIDFIMKYEGLEFMDVIRQLARRYLIDISGEKKHQSEYQGRSFKEKQEAILPGITAMRRRIRKQDYLVLLLDEQLASEHANLDRVPWLPVDPPVSQGQFLIIKKYTETVFLCAKEYELPQLLHMITNGVKAGMIIKVHTAFQELDSGSGVIAAHTDDWIRYLLRGYDHTDELLQQIKHIIAQIPDNLAYKIYQQTFIEQLNLTDEK